MFQPGDTSLKCGVSVEFSSLQGRIPQTKDQFLAWKTQVHTNLCESCNAFSVSFSASVVSFFSWQNLISDVGFCSCNFVFRDHLGGKKQKIRDYCSVLGENTGINVDAASQEQHWFTLPFLERSPDIFWLSTGSSLWDSIRCYSFTCKWNYRKPCVYRLVFAPMGKNVLFLSAVWWSCEFLCARDCAFLSLTDHWDFWCWTSGVRTHGGGGEEFMLLALALSDGPANSCAQGYVLSSEWVTVETLILLALTSGARKQNNGFRLRMIGPFFSRTYRPIPFLTSW